MTADAVIESFRVFLCSSWPSLNERVLGEQDLLEWWLQANWEVLVEGTLLFGRGEYLEVYGSGADISGASSRVSFPDSLPTAGLVASSRTGKPVRDVLSGEVVELAEELEFDQLVSWSGTFYDLSPPFDHARFECGERVIVVPLSQVTFRLQKVDPQESV